MLSPEQEFYDRQRRDDRWWLFAVVLAVIIHGAVAAMAAFLPSFFETKKTLELGEVVVISLGDISELNSNKPEGGAMAKADPPAKQEDPPQDKEPQTTSSQTDPPVEKTLPDPSDLSVSPPPTIKIPVDPPSNSSSESSPDQFRQVKEPEPLSLKPTSTKKKIARDTRLEEEIIKDQERLIQDRMKEIAQKAEAERKAREKKAAQEKTEREKWEQDERKRREKVEAARRIAAQEQREAEEEARRAQEELRKLQNAANNAGSGQQGTGGQSGTSSAVVQGYRDTVGTRLRAYWELPEIRQWDAGLSAKVRLTINRDGKVTAVLFDQSSGDPAFDELVRKTIVKASPMPAFRAVMTQESVTLGFNFTPGKLGNR